MKQALIGLLLLGILQGAAVADPAAVQFQVEPGGGTVVEAADGNVVASMPAGPLGTCQFTADTADRHQYRIERAHFDALPITLWWDPRGQWRYKTALREALLGPSTILGLSRTVRLNTVPVGTAAFTDAQDQGVESDRVLDLSGARRKVVPLSESDSEVTIPNGWSPEPVYLVRDGFEPYILQIPPGALDTEAAVWPDAPVHLRPLYGPFSYAAFNWGLVAVLLGTGLSWYLWVRPRQQARQQRQAMEQAVAREVLEARQTTRSTTGGQKSLTESIVVGMSQTRYLLLKVLGAGGMGTVYDAVPVGGSERVAVKVLAAGKSTPALRQRFEREARLCQTLQHPSIVKVLDAGFHQEIPFMVMELVSGRTLRDTPGPHPPQDVVAWLIEILKGLRLAHEAGIIHRDIKPENLMLTASGHIKIMDFGIAHEESGNLTGTKEQLGTPAYMSPEHFKAINVTPASDLFSLGVVAYEMLAGRTPYPAPDNAWAALARLFDEKPTPLLEVNPDVPPPLAAIVMRMFEVRVEDRYEDATSVLAALDLYRGSV